MEGNSPNRMSQESAERMRLAVEKLAQEVFKPEPLPQRTLPWFIDIFLYPISYSGVIHLVIFIATPLLIGFTVLRFLDVFHGVMSFIIYLLFTGYFFYYIGYCIFDSSRGGLRAPDININDSHDKNEYLSQVFFIIGITAVCFFPAIIYHIAFEKTDLVFKLLSAAGMFFFPMAVLAVVLFDSLEALNPIVIISSIYRTFLPYCGLVLVFSMIAGLILPIRLYLSQPFALLSNYLLGTAFIHYKIAFVYMVMIAAHLLGRFYLRYKNKLNWKI